MSTGLISIDKHRSKNAIILKEISYSEIRALGMIEGGSNE